MSFLITYGRHKASQRCRSPHSFYLVFLYLTGRPTRLVVRWVESLCYHAFSVSICSSVQRFDDCRLRQMVQHDVHQSVNQPQFARPSDRHAAYLSIFYRAMLCIRGSSHGLVSVSVCLCLPQVGILFKRLNTGSHNQHHTIAQGL